MPQSSSLEELQRKITAAQQEADRLEGALSQTLQRLSDEHGCSSLEEAEQKLQKLTKKANELEEEFKTALQEFEEKYADQLKAE